MSLLQILNCFLILPVPLPALTALQVVQTCLYIQAVGFNATVGHFLVKITTQMIALTVIHHVFIAVRGTYQHSASMSKQSAVHITIANLLEYAILQFWQLQIVILKLLLLYALYATLVTIFHLLKMAAVCLAITLILALVILVILTVILAQGLL